MHTGLDPPLGPAVLSHVTALTVSGVPWSLGRVALSLRTGAQAHASQFHRVAGEAMHVLTWALSNQQHLPLLLSDKLEKTSSSLGASEPSMPTACWSFQEVSMCTRGCRCLPWA